MTMQSNQMSEEVEESPTSVNASEEKIEDSITDIPLQEAEPVKSDLLSLRALVSRQKTRQASERFDDRDFDYSSPTDSDSPAKIEASMFLDDFSDGKVRNFDDLVAKYPIGGDEGFRIYVERKHPRVFRNMLIEGIQKPIETRMDFMRFASLYGAGSYVLQVYGPSPSGRLGDDGQPKLKAFTRPIKVSVPDPFGENPPNPEMAAVAIAEDEDMTETSRFTAQRRGGATAADAEIERAHLEHKTEEERIRYEREQEEQQRKEQLEVTRLQVEANKEERQLKLLEKLISDKDRELKELRMQRGGSEQQMEGVAKLLEVIKPVGPSQTEISRMQADLENERRRHTEEVSRLREQHTGEINRMRDEHSQSIERLRNDHDKITRDERARLDQMLRDKEEMSRRQIEDARNEATRRITEMQSQYEARLSDERRQHDRDLQAVRDLHQNSATTANSSYEMRLEVKQQELNRVQEELKKALAELKAEKSKDLATRIEEFSGAAEALGWTKDEGARGWKDQIGDAAVGLVQQLPMLAANVAATLKGRQPGLPMLPPQQIQASIPQRFPNPGPVFATDGVDVDLDAYSPPAQPIPAGVDPMTAGFVPEEEYEEDDDEEEVVEELAGLPAKPISIAPPSGESGMQVTDEMIVQFAETFRGALKEGADPEAFGEELVKQLGPMLSGTIVHEVSLKRVKSVLQKASGGDQDPLLRRDGQKFLDTVWNFIKNKVK